MRVYEYSTKSISSELLETIANSIRGKSYGSVEIYIQDSQVTQITERVITKVNNSRSQSAKPKYSERTIQTGA